MAEENESPQNRLVVHRMQLYDQKRVDSMWSFRITHIAPGITSKNYYCLIARDKNNISDFFRASDNEFINIIELYKTSTYGPPKLQSSMTVCEKISGIFWSSKNDILTTSKQQTICLYSASSGTLMKSLITDYGPILCSHYCRRTNLLFTGTEFGYVVVYRELNGEIEYLSKMVKINGPITCIGSFVTWKPDSGGPSSPKRIRKPYMLKRKKKCRLDEGEIESSEEESDTDEDIEVKETENVHSAPINHKPEIKIYGACLSELIVFDFQTKSITDTIRVRYNGPKETPKIDKYGRPKTIPVFKISSLMVLNNGDVVVGDSKGSISIFNYNSLTCKQTTKILDCEITSLSKDPYKGNKFLVSGRRPYVILMKSSTSDRSEFKIMDRAYLHKTGSINCMSSITFKNYLVGGENGVLMSCNVQTVSNVKQLVKHGLLPPLKDCIKYSNQEILVQNERLLSIWHLGNVISDSLTDQPIEDLKPTNDLGVRTKNYIQASCFSSKWLCYSTKGNVNIYFRAKRTLVTLNITERIENCHLLQLTEDDKYLVACVERNVILIDLNLKKVKKIISKNQSKEEIEGSFDPTKKVLPRLTYENLPVCQVTSRVELRSRVQNMLNPERGYLILNSGPFRNFIYCLRYGEKKEKDNQLWKEHKINLDPYRISFIYNNPILNTSASYNEHDDDTTTDCETTDNNDANNESNNNDNSNSRYVWLMTTSNQLAKLDYANLPEILQNDFIKQLFNDTTLITKLGRDSTILGMAQLNGSHCILFDNRSRFLKVGLSDERELLKETNNTNFVISLDNSVTFGRTNHLVSIELTPANLGMDKSIGSFESQERSYGKS